MAEEILWEEEQISADLQELEDILDTYESEAWQGEKQETFYKDYTGDYMTQCQIYLAGLGRTTGEIQAAKNVRERELDEVQSLIKDITEEIEALTGAGC